MMCFQKKFRLARLSPTPRVDRQITRLTPAFSIARTILRVPSNLMAPFAPAPSAHSTASCPTAAFQGTPPPPTHRRKPVEFPRPP